MRNFKYYIMLLVLLCVPFAHSQTIDPTQVRSTPAYAPAAPVTPLNLKTDIQNVLYYLMRSIDPGHAHTILKSPSTTGFVSITGMGAGSTRIKTVRDANDTILELGGGSYTPTGTWVWTSATATWPTFNQNTTGSAAKWTTARNLAGNSVDGSADVAFSNKFIAQGTTDTGLTGAQFLGALSSGMIKNTTSTGVLSIGAIGTDYSVGTSTLATGILKSTTTTGALSIATVGTDYSVGTSALATGMLKSTTTTGALSIGTSGTDYSAGTSALSTGILKSTTTTGALTIAAVSDFPTLNQNTTGSANSLKSPSTTGLVTIAGMSAGNTRAKTVRDVDDTIMEVGGSYNPTGTWSWVAGTPTVTWPTFNQNTTGSAAKWTTTRNLAGNSVDGSANVAFSNKYIVQGTTDAGLSGAQFLGALATGMVKNTTSTGVLSVGTVGTDYSVGTSALATGIIKSTTATGALSIATSGTDYSAGTSALATGIIKSTTSTGALTIAAAGDFPTLNQSTTGSAASLKSTATTGLMTVTGPGAGTTRAKTIRDADDTILELGGSYTPSATWNWTSATATWPTFNQNTSGTAASLSAVLAANLGGAGTVSGMMKANGTGTVSAATSGTDYSAGTSALTTGMVKSTTTSGALSIGVSGTDYSAGTSALTTGILKSTTTTGTLTIAASGDFPTLNQNTTGSAAKWTTARNLAGNSVDGSANVAFSNKYIVQGTTDAGLSGAQFLGALSTGIIKNTTSTGVLSVATSGTDYSAGTSVLETGILKSTTTTGALTIATSGDFPVLNQSTTGSANSLKSPSTTGLVTIAGMSAGNTRAKTVRDVDDTIMEVGGSYNPTGTWSWVTGTPTVTWPTFNQNTSGTAASLSAVLAANLGGAGAVSGIMKANGSGTVSAATSGTDYSVGTSALATGMVKSTTTTGVLSIGTSGTDYSAGTSALTTGILKSTTSTGALTIAAAGDFPTLNQSTTGSAAKWTTARNLAGNSVDGSTNVAFANKFIVQGTTDTGLSSAQFLGALATGMIKNTTSTGVLSVGTAGTDYSAGTSALATGIVKSTTSTGTLSIATSGTDYSVGTSALATGMVKSTTTTGALSIGTSGTDYSAGTSALSTGILKSTTTTGALTIAAAGDFPTLNQNSSGSAGSLKSVATTGLMTVTGPGAGVTRAKTIRDADDTLLELGGSYTPSATWNWTSASVTWPTFNQNTSGTAASLSAVLAANLGGAGTVSGVMKANGSGTVSAATSGTDYSPGTSSLATGIIKSTTITGALSVAISGTDYSAGTSALSTGILKSTTTTGALTIATAGDFPTFNQGTTGSAGSLKSTATTGLMTIIGPGAGTTRAKTIRDADDTIMEVGGSYNPTGTWSWVAGTPTITWPTFNQNTSGTAASLSAVLAANLGGAGTVSGIMKANGTGTVSAATSGTDYSAGTSALTTGIIKSTAITGALTIAAAGDFPTLNQSTTGSAAKWTTARNLAGNSVDGSTSVAFANKFVVQGTTDTGLTGAQFLGALGTGIVKNTTSTGVLSISTAGTDYSVGTSALATGMIKSTTSTGALSIGTAGTDYSAGTSVLSTGILKSTTSTGALTIASAGDFPALNQSTTGSANSLKSPSTTGLVTIAGMSAGNTRAKTVRDVDDTIMEVGGNYNPTGTWSWVTGTPTVTWPTFNQNTSGTAASLSAVLAANLGGAGTVSGMLEANGAGTVSAATSGTDYSAGTSALATGIVKSTTTTGALSIATSGTDYSAGTSALSTGILKSTTTTGALTIAAAGDFPTLNQSTTGSAAKWTTARNLAGNSVDGTANVAFSNKFVVQGTTDTGLSGSQFLGALTTGMVKNTTTTGILSIGTSGTDYAPGTSALTTGIVKSTTTTGALSIAASGTDYSAGTSALATGMVKSTTATGALSIGTSGTDYSAGTSALTTGILKSTTTTGALTIAAAGDFPTFNQATSGSAGSLKSVATTGLMTITGPGAGVTRAKTIRDADDTILELGGTYTPSATWNWTSASVTWPTFNQNTSGTAASLSAVLAANLGGAGTVSGMMKANGSGTVSAATSGTDYSTGTSALATGMVKSTTTTGALSIGTVGTDYSAGTSALTTGILKSTTTTGALTIAAAGDFPTLNQSTTGSAAKWTTSRNLAGNSVDGSANVAFANKFIVQGTTDTGLSGAQFLGSLATGIVKNTTSTGVLSVATSGTDYAPGTSALSTGILKSTTTTGALTIASAEDFPTLNQGTSGSAGSLKSTATTGLMTIIGPGAGTTRAKTVRDSDDTLLELGGSYTPSATWNWTSASATWPTFNQNTSGTAGSLSAVLAANLGGAGTVSGIMKANGSGTVSTATSGTDYSAGTSALTTGMVKSTTTTGALSIGTAGTDYSAGTSALTTGILKSTTATGALTIAAAGDFPTFNQGTTGSAGSLKSPSTTGLVTIAGMSAGNTRAKTVRDADDTIMEVGGSYNPTGTWSWITGTPTVTWPTFNQNTSGTAASLSAVLAANLGGAGAVSGMMEANGSGTVSAATSGTDYSAGTSALATGILKSTTSTGALSIATSGTDYSAGTSALTTGILKSTTSTGALTIAAVVDFPTLNQSTSGSAGSLKSVATTGLMTITGPAIGTTRAKTVRDANDTILELGGGSYTPTGTWVWTSASATWPTFNQTTTGSAAKWTTARNLAGNSVDGSANVAFSNKFVVQGTTDTGLSGAQFLGALTTGMVKNTTSTGVLSIGTAGTDYSTGTSTLTTGILKSTTSTGALSIATSGTDYSAGTSALATGMVKSTTTTGALSIGTVGTDYSAGTSALTTGILKSTTATGALTIADAGDFPTLNQGTTGSAGSLKSVATTGLMTITGPAIGTTRAKTVRDADDTIMEVGGSYNPTGTWNWVTGTPTITWPTFNQNTSGTAASLSAVLAANLGGAGTVSGMMEANGAGTVSAATSGTDYSAGTSALATGIIKSTTATGVLSIATSGTDYSAGTSALATGIIKSTTVTGALTIAAAGDFPTLNQSTTGSAAKWTTARNLAGNSVDGSANVAFANKFIAQGTADTGLSGAQFLGALTTGMVKNTTTTGVLSIGTAGTDYSAGTSALTTGIVKSTTTTGALSIASVGTDYSAGTSALTTGMVKSTTATGALSIGTAGTDYSAGTSALSTGILKSTTATGVLTIAAAGDFPTLNQGTTGSAGSLKSTATTGLMTITGPGVGTTRAKTVRDADDTLLELGGSYTPSGTWVWTSATATWPTFNQNTSGTAASLSAVLAANLGGAGTVSGVMKANGSGTVSSATSGTDYSAGTSALATGMIKSTTTTGVLSIGTSGIDYSAGTSALATGIVKSTTTTGALTIAAAGDFPTLNQTTTGSAAKWTTARNLAGNSVDGSANVAFANKFIVQGTVDAGLSGSQFLGALATGMIKNTTTTGILSVGTAGSDYSAGTSSLATGILKSTTTTGALTIAAAGDFPTLNQSTTGSASSLKSIATTGLMTITGPGIGLTRAKTVRDADDTIIEVGGSYTPSATWNWTSASVTWPTFNQNTSGTAASLSAVLAANLGGAGTVSGMLEANGSGTVSAATSGTDYSAGTAALSTGILKSTTTTGALSIATSGTDYSAGTSALTTGILKSTTATGALTIAAAGDFPTLNQSTTGSAAKWTTARNLAGNSVDGSANVAFSNKFIVQGTADTGLSGSQFLGALTTGIVKNTTTTGVLTIGVSGTDYSAGTSALGTGILKSTTSTGALTIAAAGDFPALNQATSGSAGSLKSVATTGLMTITGPGAGTTRAKTVRDANDTIMEVGGSYNPTGTWSWTAGTPTVTWPTFNQNTSGTAASLSAVLAANLGGAGTVSGMLEANGSGTVSAATSGTDYSAGTAALVTGMVKSTTTTGALSIGVSGTDYSAGTSALTTGILKSTTTTGALTIAAAGDFPTLNQTTTGSAAKWTTARNLAGNSVDGSANVAFSNKFIVQGTTDTGLSGSQFLGALTTGMVKNTTSTGVLTIGTSGTDYAPGTSALATGIIKSTTSTGVLSVATSGTDYSAGTSALATGMVKSTTSTGALSIGVSGTDYSAGTAALTTGILKSTTATGVLTIAAAGDFPTFNQGTTGSAGSLKSTTTTGLMTITGPAIGTTRVKTIRDADDTIMEVGGSYNPTGTWSWTTGTPTVTWPTFNQNTSGTAASLSAVLAANLGGAGTVSGMMEANGSGTVSAATSGTDYSAGTAALTTGILKSTTTTGALTIAAAGDFPTLNQSTTGSAAKWTTARNLAGNSVDGTANVAFANKYVVQGTTDTGLSGAQFLGALTTGMVKNTTTTGVLSIGTAGTDYSAGTSALATGIIKSTITTGALTIAAAGDFPTLNQSTTGSAAKWTTARNLAGNSVDGTANVAFANKYVVQGTTDTGLSGAQFLGALATGIVKNTTTTGVLSIGTAGTDYSAGTSTLTTGILKSTTTTGALTIAAVGDFPTLNQSTTGTAAKWTTARNLAGNSVDGSANVAFTNKFIVQGTTDAGLSGSQFLGALTTGMVKNTTTTGVLSVGTAGTDYSAGTSALATGILKSTTSTGALTIAAAGDFPALNQSTTNSAGSLKSVSTTGLMTITGPGAGTTRAKTVRDADDTIMEVGGSYTPTGTWSWASSTTTGLPPGAFANQNPNTVLAGPASGGAGAVTARALVAADLPADLPQTTQTITTTPSTVIHGYVVLDYPSGGGGVYTVYLPSIAGHTLSYVTIFHKSLFPESVSIKPSSGEKIRLRIGYLPGSDFADTVDGSYGMSMQNMTVTFIIVGDTWVASNYGKPSIPDGGDYILSTPSVGGNVVIYTDIAGGGKLKVVDTTLGLGDENPATYVQANRIELGMGSSYIGAIIKGTSNGSVEISGTTASGTLTAATASDLVLHTDSDKVLKIKTGTNTATLTADASSRLVSSSGFYGALTGNVTGNTSGSAGSLKSVATTGLMTITGPGAGATRAKTIRDADDTIMEVGGSYNPTGIWNWVTGTPTVTWPTFNQNTSGTAASLSAVLAANLGGAGTVSGMLEANGFGTVSAATSGTDYSAGTSALTTGILKSTTTTGALTIAAAGDFPTLNQSTTGTAAKWTTARNLAGNSVDGSTNVAFTNKFIIQGTADAGLTGGQFLGALATGMVKNTTTTGVLSVGTSGTDYSAGTSALTTGILKSTTTTGALTIAAAGDFPTLNQSTTGSAAKWTTARNLAGNSVDGSTNVAFANKFIVQGTADTGLSGSQFLGALATGIIKNTTTTGVLSTATSGTDYAPGTSALATGMIKSTTSTGALSIGTSGTDYSLGTSALATGILKSTTTTGALTIAAAGDFPTLNQSTTGNAGSLKSTATTGLMTITGPGAGVTRVKTVRDADDTILELGGSYTPTGTWNWASSTITGLAPGMFTSQNANTVFAGPATGSATTPTFRSLATADIPTTLPTIVGSVLFKNTTNSTTSFQIQPAASTTPVLNIDTTNSHVGIGKANPTVSLDVVGDVIASGSVSSATFIGSAASRGASSVLTSAAYIDVSFGATYGAAPNVVISPTANPAVSGVLYWWVSDVSTTGFRINVDQTPTYTAMPFNWQAQG